MNTLIAYASKYGCTEKCAGILSQKLKGKVELYNLKSGKPIDLSIYDNVIIGSSVYAGRTHKETKEFCTNNLELLKNKRLGLFICGTQIGEQLEQELISAYPEELRSIAVALECFGGEYSFSKLNFLEKTLVKMITKSNQDFSNIKEEKIDSLAQAIICA